MRFRLPTPLRGWREFAGEVGIIVLGVLIALAADDLVDDWHWQGQVKIANAAIKDEVGYAAMLGYERLAIQPCLRGRITELDRRLQASGPEWQAFPETAKSPRYLNVMPVVYRAPQRPLLTVAWRNALATGTLNHMPAANVQRLSAIYEVISWMDQLKEEENKAAARLTPLAYDRRLADASRADFVAALAEVDRINTLLAVNARHLIDSVRELRLGFDPAEVEQVRQEAIAEQRRVRGGCVSAPPIALN